MLEVVNSRGGRIFALVVAAVLAIGVCVAAVLLTREDERQPSAEAFIEVDDLDCVTGIYASTDFALDPDDGGEIVVCHYEKQPLRSEPSHRLDWSRLFTAEKSAEVRQAVAGAPRGRLPFVGCDVAENGPGEFFLVRTAEGVPYWVDNATCGQNGVLALGPNGKVQHRHTTAELLAALGSSYGVLGPTSQMP